MGRSPAAAFIAACLYNPSVDELEVASALRRLSSTARGHALDLVGLAECFEQADAAAVPVEAIHIVQDYRLVAVLVGLQVNAKGGSIAIDPANR